MSELRKELEQLDRDEKEKHPEADAQVLQFITDMICCGASTFKEYNVIHQMFRAGYCWHFAHTLKETFKRGEVCWAAPYSHFVWADNNGMAYDIEGLSLSGYDYLIPEDYLGEFLKDFIHIPGEHCNVTEKDIVAIIRRYEDDHNLPHKDYKGLFIEYEERND